MGACSKSKSSEHKPQAGPNCYSLTSIAWNFRPLHLFKVTHFHGSCYEIQGESRTVRNSMFNEQHVSVSKWLHALHPHTAPVFITHLKHSIEVEIFASYSFGLFWAVASCCGVSHPLTRMPIAQFFRDIRLYKQNVRYDNVTAGMVMGMQKWSGKAAKGCAWTSKYAMI